MKFAAVEVGWDRQGAGMRAVGVLRVDGAADGIDREVREVRDIGEAAGGGAADPLLALKPAARTPCRLHKAPAHIDKVWTKPGRLV